MVPTMGVIHGACRTLALMKGCISPAACRSNLSGGLELCIEQIRLHYPQFLAERPIHLCFPRSLLEPSHRLRPTTVLYRPIFIRQFALTLVAALSRYTLTPLCHNSPHSISFISYHFHTFTSKDITVSPRPKQKSGEVSLNECSLLTFDFFT